MDTDPVVQDGAFHRSSLTKEPPPLGYTSTRI